jgi:hypothetical protein
LHLFLCALGSPPPRNTSRPHPRSNKKEIVDSYCAGRGIRSLQQHSAICVWGPAAAIRCFAPRTAEFLPGASFKSERNFTVTTIASSQRQRNSIDRRLVELVFRGNTSSYSIIMNENSSLLSRRAIDESLRNLVGTYSYYPPAHKHTQSTTKQVRIV